MKKNFLTELQEEAVVQKKLNEERIFPEFFDGATSFIGIYSWQTILALAVATAVLAEVF